jgi:hypothetical protein
MGAMKERLKRWWMAGLWFVTVTVVLTWPTVIQPGTAALGSPKADGMKHLWTLWWMRASVWREGSFPFNTTLVNFPKGMDLYPIEPLNGLVAIGAPFIDIILLSNLLVMVNLFATGMVGCWFGRLLTDGNRLAGLAAGTVLLTGSVTAFFVTVGVGELTHLWWLPLGLGLLIKALKTDSWKAWAWVAMSMVGAVLSCFYLGFFLGCAVGVICAYQLLVSSDRFAQFKRMAFAAGLLLVIVLPIGRVFALSYAAPEFDRDPALVHIFAEKGQQVTDSLGSRLDPAQLFAYGRVATTEHEQGYGGGRYLGAIVCLLALVGLIRRPREALPWLLVALMALWFSMGSYLTMGGEEIKLTASGSRVRLPMLWLNRLLELIAEPVNFPVRFLALVLMAQAALVALAVERSWGKWLTILVPLGAIEISAGQLISWPWPVLQIPQTWALERLAQHPGRAVLDVGLTLQADASNRALALAGQMSHQHPTNTVPLERIEFFAREGYTLGRSMHLVDDINGLYYHEDPRGMQDDYREDLTMLKEQGFDILLISTKDGRRNIPERAFQALRQLCGEPIADGPGGVAWEIRPVQPAPTPRELEVWRQNLAQRIKDWERKLQPMKPGP